MGLYPTMNAPRPAYRFAHAGYRGSFGKCNPDEQGVTPQNCHSVWRVSAPPNPPHTMLLLLQHLLQQLLRPLQSFARENHRFHLADRIVDHVLVVQSAEHIPIESFPGPAAVMQCQIKQRQRRVVDLVCIEGHREPPTAAQFAPSYYGSDAAQSQIDF